MSINYTLSQITPVLAEPLDKLEVKPHLKVTLSNDDAYIESLITAARELIEMETGRALVQQTWQYTLDAFPESRDIAIELPYSPLLQVDSITYTDIDGNSQTWSSANYTVDKNYTPGRFFPIYNEEYPVTRDVKNAVTIQFTAGYATNFTTDFGSDANQLDAVGHTFSNGDKVRLYNSAATVDLPGGLAENVDHYVVNAGADLLELSLTSGGSEVTLTDNGTGLHFIGVIPRPIRHAMLFLVGHWYSQREEVLIGVNAQKIPMGAERLLSSYRVINI